MLWRRKTSGGIHYEHISNIDSTNRALMDRGLAGERSIAVLIADKQTGGRGRGEKAFLSPRGGLYFSILLPTEATCPAALTVSAALAVADSLESLGLSPRVKWVNDICLNGKKTAGILAEGACGFAVVGIGINVKAPRSGFHPSISPIATSLCAHTNKKISRESLCFDITNRFFSIYPAFGEKHAEILARYRALSCLDGETVEVFDGEIAYTAKVIGINDDFSLELERGEDHITLSFGEVSIKRRTE